MNLPENENDQRQQQQKQQQLHKDSLIVRPEYLDEATGKKDLVRRLTHLVRVLRQTTPEGDPIVQVDDPECWPGVEGLARVIVQPSYLAHGDADVRMHALLASLEILILHAPDSPWDNGCVLNLFAQVTRKLGSLAVVTTVDHRTDVTARYTRHILNQLAEYEMGCLLVPIVHEQQQQQLQQQLQQLQNGHTASDDENNNNNSDSDDASNATKEPVPKRHARVSSATESALDILVDFLTALLHGVRRDHSSDILTLVETSVTATLSSYTPDSSGIPIPIPVLDVLLRCIGQGPTQLILQSTNANANVTATAATTTTKHKKSKAAAAAAATVQQVRVSNPTYHLAANVIRTLLNKIAEPISQLINGLLNADPHYSEQSSIQCPAAAAAVEPVPVVEVHRGKHHRKSSTVGDTIEFQNEDDDNVYNIIFELHRVAPQILATVLGTVASGLRSTLPSQRHPVTLVLGRLFASPDDTVASEYASTYRDWLGRKVDADPLIRLCMVRQCRAIVARHKESTTMMTTTTAIGDPEVEVLAADALNQLISTDPSLDVRLEGIHLVCEWAYKPSSANSPVMATLLHAVGSRVSAKHKQERRDAVTGLASVYFRQWCQPHLTAVMAGGNDCDTALVIQTLRKLCSFPEDWQQPPKHSPHGRRRRSSSSRSRKHDSTTDEQYRWIPTKVLECVCFSDHTDTEMRSRIIQIVDEVLLGSSKKLTPTAQALAWTVLLNSVVSFDHDGDGSVLDLLHSTGSGKQQHSNAFKFLQLLMGQRALLQKTTSRYIDLRVELRKCSPGTEESLEVDARALDALESLSKITAPVDVSVKVAPDDVLQAFHAARDNHVFKILATIVRSDHTAQARSRALDELPRRTKSLGPAVSDWVKNLVKRCAMGDSLNSTVASQCILLAKECLDEEDVASCGAFVAAAKFAIDIFPSICTSRESFEALTEIFSNCRSSTGEMKKELQARGIFTALSSILSKVVTVSSKHTGADDDNASTTSNDLKNHLIQLCTRDGTPEQARNAVHTLARLVNADTVSSIPASNEVFRTLLHTLTSAAKLKLTTNKTEALKVVSVLSALSAFADCAPLVLTESAKGDRAFKFAFDTIVLGLDDDDITSTGELEEDTDKSPSRTPKRSSLDSQQKHATPRAKESILENEDLSVACRTICAALEFLVCYVRSTSLLLASQPSEAENAKVVQPPKDQISLLFQTLSRILEDRGVPPSNRDRKLCRTRSDRAALRQCAAVALIRLCDTRLGLEKTMMSHFAWHTLGRAFVDEEVVVRDGAMEELSMLFRGAGIYGLEKTHFPPKVPSLRIVSLAVLCDSGELRSAVRQCIMNLRKATEAAYTQCCAMGTEQKFESQYKMLLMPEYCVPFAFHLLSHQRKSTFEASVDDEVSGFDKSTTVDGHREGLQRTLRKRMKLLFDPLVQSLGDEADNISFLLRMTEILGKHYTPLGVVNSTPRTSHSRERPVSSKRTKDLDSALKNICAVASESLVSYIKTDAHLTTFSGPVQLPKSLFTQRHVKVQAAFKQDRKTPVVDGAHSEQSPRRSVTFSPDVAFRYSDDKGSSPRRQHSSNKRKDVPIDTDASIASPRVACSVEPGSKSSSSDATKSTHQDKETERTPDATVMFSIKSSGASTVTLSQQNRSNDSSSSTQANKKQRTSTRSRHPLQSVQTKKAQSKTSASAKRRDSPPKQIEVTTTTKKRPSDDGDFDEKFSDEESNQSTPSSKRAGSASKKSMAAEDDMEFRDHENELNQPRTKARGRRRVK